MPKLSDYAVDEEVLHLSNALQSVLDSLVNVYASANMPLPTRRYWTVASPVWDCEQAVVSFVQLYLGTPGDEASQPLPCNSPKSMVITVSVSRETASTRYQGKSAPPPELIQQDSEWVAADTWLIMDTLKEFNPWLGGAPAMIATSTVPEPSGGVMTTSVQMTMIVP